MSHGVSLLPDSPPNKMGMNEHMSEAQALALVKQAGVVDPTQANEMAELLIAAGLTMPSAWAQIEKRELVELGVPLGYTAALIAEAQRFMAGRCGAQFVRVMEGSVRSEKVVAAQILKAQHVGLWQAGSYNWWLSAVLLIEPH